MAQEILCEVNNCTFWDSGNKCTAEKNLRCQPEGATSFK